MVAYVSIDSALQSVQPPKARRTKRRFVRPIQQIVDLQTIDAPTTNTGIDPKIYNRNGVVLIQYGRTGRVLQAWR